MIRVSEITSSNRAKHTTYNMVIVILSNLQASVSLLKLIVEHLDTLHGLILNYLACLYYTSLIAV